VAEVEAITHAVATARMQRLSGLSRWRQVSVRAGLAGLGG